MQCVNVLLFLVPKPGPGNCEEVPSSQFPGHTLGGVLAVVEEPEMKYWRTSLDIMAKDCVGLPASYNTALKMELLAAIHRFRNVHEEGVAKPGPNLMLHAYRNFGFPAPQPQPQAQQHHPPSATTVAGVQGQPVLYHACHSDNQPASPTGRPSPSLLLPSPFLHTRWQHYRHCCGRRLQRHPLLPTCHLMHLQRHLHSHSSTSLSLPPPVSAWS